MNTALIASFLNSSNDKLSLKVKDIPWASLVAHTVKNLPAMWKSQVQSLSQEDPLENGMATHSSIFAWRIYMDRGTWQATVHGVAKSRT